MANLKLTATVIEDNYPMIRFCVSMFIVFASVLAYANGSSDVGDGSSRQSIVKISEYPRVIVYEKPDYTFTSNGEMLVCRFPNSASYTNKCTDSAGSNRWERVQDIKIPGYVLDGYEIRTSRYNYLVLYFRAQ